MSEIGEIIIDMDNNNNMENSDAPAEEPPILHTKKFRISSGNIIGKGVIQDFFTCAGALPSMGSSILHRTSSLADAISMLIVELERQFMHMHPCIQRIFLEFSNIEHSSLKRAATIFLAHEFRFIIKEAKEIFAHCRVDAGRPPIEAIHFDQEEIMCFQSLDYVAFNENLRKKVPTNVLVDRISELNNDFAIRNNELGYSLEYRLTKFCQKNAYNDELVVPYEGPKEEPIPPKIDLGDFCPIKFRPFDYFCLPQRKLPAERREYEMSFRDLSYYYGNT